MREHLRLSELACWVSHGFNFSPQCFIKCLNTNRDKLHATLVYSAGIPKAGTFVVLNLLFLEKQINTCAEVMPAARVLSRDAGTINAPADGLDFQRLIHAWKDCISIWRSGL